jgi:alkylation response protein AidB-like acyl-CoA dehydrogenase
VNPEREQLVADIHASAVDLLDSAKTRETLLRAKGGEPFPDAAWEAIVKAGWAQTIVPEEKGGLGLRLTELAAIFRAVGRRPVRGPLLDLCVTAPLLAAHAPALADGAICVLAEAPAPPYGKGLDAVTLRNGKLEGSIDLVPFAQHAEHLVVVASGPAIALVNAADAEIEPMPSHDPTIEYTRVRFEGAPVEQVIEAGEAGEARALLETIHATLRLMVAAELAGGAAELTDMSVEYSKRREQFGRPIAGFQALRHILARMATRSKSLDNLVAATLEDAERDPARLPELGRLAKAYSSVISRQTAEDALQVHGGMGFTAEYPLHLYMRRALSTEGYLGETADLLVELGEAVLAG